jgi:hypothetical protein
VTAHRALRSDPVLALSAMADNTERGWLRELGDHLYTALGSIMLIIGGLLIGYLIWGMHWGFDDRAPAPAPTVTVHVDTSVP